MNCVPVFTTQETPSVGYEGKYSKHHSKSGKNHNLSSSPNAKTLLHLTLFRLHSLEAQKNFSDLKNSHRLPPLRKFSNEASFFIELSRGVQWLNQKIVPEYQQGSHWKGSSANYSFSDTPFHPYGRKWKTLKRVIFNGGGKSSSVIFRPTFSMGEENHHLCCVFFQILPKLHFVQLHSTYSVSLLSLHPSY